MGNVCSGGRLNDSSKRKKRIAIIGAGPAGLSALHAFAQAILLDDNIEKTFELVCFEQRDHVGGQWYDSAEEMPNVTGLYEAHEKKWKSNNFWTNGPKECMEYADYTFQECFGKSIPSYPLRERIWEYLEGRAVKSDIIKYIKFLTTVRWVHFDDKASEFIINVEDVDSNHTFSYRFDTIIIATGHSTMKGIPYIDGLVSFNGPVLHSYHFRDPEIYRGKRILIIGSSDSAEYVVWHCLQNGALSITVTDHNAIDKYYKTNNAASIDHIRGDSSPFTPASGNLNIDMRPLLHRIQGRNAYFADDSCVEVDVVVLCTGLRFEFPYLDSALKLNTPNCLYPSTLYKGVAWTENPNRLFYIGMQAQYLTNQLYDAQAWWARDVILGKIKLPSKHAMLTDIGVWKADGDSQKTNIAKINFQARHLKDLWKKTNCPRFNVDAVEELFKEWELIRRSDIMTSRSKPFKSAINGTVGKISNVAWCDLTIQVDAISP